MNLQEQLMNLVDEFDSIQEQWALSKAAKDEIDDRKHPTLAIVESNVEGNSEAERRRKALKSTTYEAWIQEAKRRREDFYKIDHKKQGILSRIDVLRSIQSFNKFMQEVTT